MTTHKRVQLELTETQRAQIKAETGQEPESVEVELAVEELEERIAPMSAKPVRKMPL
ncbi:MAG: hypothetical protein ACJ8AM_00160 [Gemmatimonadales bacterium]